MGIRGALAMKSFLLLLSLAALLRPAVPTKLSGSAKYSDEHGFVSFLTKFGVKKGSDVFFFGNATRRLTRYIDFHSQATLVFIPYSAWKHFFRASEKSSANCDRLINRTLSDSILTSGYCIGGHNDYLRQLPCPEGYRCENQPKSVATVSRTQFTFRLTPAPETEYYYVVLAACTNNGTSMPTCKWVHSSDVSFTYSMHLVNEDPDTTSDPNPFIYEFPYDLQSLLLIFITFSSCYYALLAFHALLNTRLCMDRSYGMHRLVKIFTLSLVLEAVHVSFVVIHLAVYASNGVGVEVMKYVGEVANQVSDWLLILVFVLIGKGWQLTTATIRWKKVSFFIWGFYMVFSALYFAWLVVVQQVYPYTTYTEHPYQTWAGGLYLAYRLLLLIYILYEMRQVYLVENRRLMLNIYRLLFAFFIVWFCYLPLIVLVCVGINPLEREKVISTTYLSFDLLANVVMVLLFCPRWADTYFQFKNQINEFSRIHMRLRDKSVEVYGSSISLGSSVSGNFERKD